MPIGFRHEQQKHKNYAVFIALLLLCVLFFALTLYKLS